MTPVEVAKADFMGWDDENLRDQIVVPKILRIKNQDLNNFRRKLLNKSAQLPKDCWQNLSRYTEMITQAAGVSKL